MSRRYNEMSPLSYGTLGERIAVALAYIIVGSGLGVAAVLFCIFNFHL